MTNTRQAIDDNVVVVGDDDDDSDDNMICIIQSYGPQRRLC